MRYLIIVIFIGSLFIVNTSIQAQRLEFSPEIVDYLELELAKSHYTYELDSEVAESIDAFFRDWVSLSIDFETANVRESDRFEDRITYSQQIETNVPLFLDRQGNNNGLNTDHPIDVFYKRSKNWYSFRKLIDFETSNVTNQDNAIDKVKDFLIRNQYVYLSNIDGFGDISTYLLGGDIEMGNSFTGEEKVILQGVKFNRMFSGSNVVNSRISIDFHPDTYEILGFKHYYWTPVKIDSKESINEELLKNSDEIFDMLNQSIRKYCSIDDQVEIVSITPAWFQSDNKMLPIVSIEIEVTRAENDQTTFHTELVNIAGSNNVFYPARQQRIRPENAPD